MRALNLRKKIFYYCIMIFLLGIVLCLMGSLTLLTLEIYVRVSRPNIDLYGLTGRVIGVNPISEWAIVDAFCAYRPKPNQYNEGKTVNSHGFFSTPEISLEKPQDTIRILFLGGSSTAGQGHILADTDTWPWQTVEMIRNEVSHHVDFINGAAAGYSSFESFGRLWSRLRHFSPDIVVLYAGSNEMYYFNDEGMNTIHSWRTLQDGSWSLARTREPIPVYSPHWIDPIIRKSQALIRIRLRFFEPQKGLVVRQRDRPLNTDFNHDALDVWRTNLRLFRETSDVIGAKLFVAKQATLLIPNMPPDTRDWIYREHGFDHNTHVKAFSEIYRIIDEEIPENSIIDVTPLSGYPEYFANYIHPTPQGSTQIAKIMAEAIVQYIEELQNNQKD